MAEFPAIPLWTDSFLADTTHLSAEEIGIFMLLLMASWRRPDCDLPDDDAYLCRIARVSRTDWDERVRPCMLAFFQVSSGLWTQKRLRAEREKVKARSERARANGKMGGRPISNETNEVAKPTALPEPNPDITQTKASISISISNKKDSSDGFDDFWKLYPLRVARGQAEKAWRSAIKTTSAETILARLKTFTWPEDGRYTPRAASWLNGKRWLDEGPASKADAEPAVKAEARAHANQILASMIKKRMSPGVDFSPQRARELITAGLITADDATKVGCPI